MLRWLTGVSWGCFRVVPPHPGRPTSNQGQLRSGAQPRPSPPVLSPPSLCKYLQLLVEARSHAPRLCWHCRRRQAGERQRQCCAPAVSPRPRKATDCAIAFWVLARRASGAEWIGGNVPGSRLPALCCRSTAQLLACPSASQLWLPDFPRNFLKVFHVTSRDHDNIKPKEARQQQVAGGVCHT